ncbi:MAG: DUF3105 domain-containing protein [Rhodococcus sp.]|nr:DUF3105 domain-containing protein [Rhodococcus sp. (in: high G+C Gram-positive bacteria)]
MPSGTESGGPGKKSGAKSAKALKAAKKKSGGDKPRGAKPPRQIPWLTIGAVVAVVALITVLAVNLYPKYQATEAAAEYQPSAETPDPSDKIDGVEKIDYPAGIHVQPTQRVAYDKTPPFGGPHDGTWATCTGTVYEQAIRTENAVHSLEHGAVWIAYNPDTVSGDALETLEDKVDGETYMMLSPYPGLDTPVALQSWGHQLKVDSVDDERIDQFITALRLNQNTYPEVGASCSSIPGSGFDPENPPAFDPAAPGPDAVPMDGGNIAPDPSEIGGAPAGGAVPPAGQLPPEVPQAPAGQ